MKHRTYDLWDFITGNMIGAWDTEAEALLIVRELLDLNSLEYADELGFGWLDSQGSAHPIATGATLVDRVRAVPATATASQALAKQR